MSLPAIDWGTDWPTLGTWALAGVLVLAVVGVLVKRAAEAAARTVRGRGPMVLAALVAVLLTALSADSILRVLRDVMGLTDAEAWGFFAALDLAVLASAVLARHRRRLIARIGGDSAIPIDGVAVWIIAALEGTIGAWSQTSVEGTLIRGAAPLLAAWLYERALALEVAEIRGVSRATLSRVGAGLAAAWQQAKRVLARWGLIATSDQTIADVHWSRWARRVSRAAYRVERIPTTAKGRDRRVAAATARVDRLVSGMQQRGLLDRPADRQRLIDRPTDRRLIVAALLGRPIDQTQTVAPIDRPVPRPTDPEPIDRPTEPVPVTDRPADVTPTDRPAPEPVDRPTDPVTPTVTDRPTPRRTYRTKEENEALIMSALREFVGDADSIALPSQGDIAKLAGVGKSTVQAFLSRTDLSSAGVVTRQFTHPEEVHTS